MHPSYLSDDFVKQLRALGAQLATGSVEPKVLQPILKHLDALQPGSAIRVDESFRALEGLFWGAMFERPRWLEWVKQPVGQRELHLHAMARTPDLAFLFLFHRDGFLREAALNAIQRTASPFFLTAISLRLNDWVPDVREAAVRCGQRAFGYANPRLIAEAGLFIFAHRGEWRRGGQTRTLDRLLNDQANLEALAGLICERQDRWVGRAFDAALRDGFLDAWLPILARKATSPSIRVKAWRALIASEARWRDGYDRKWIDKAYNITRRVPRLARRPLLSPLSTRSAIAEAGADRSPAVRRVAAQALVERRCDLDDVAELVTPMLVDRCASVRQKAHFVAEDLGLLTAGSANPAAH